MERIAKFLSRAGVCSRRDAEKLIQEGRVKINGVILETPATLVSGEEKIEVNGKTIHAKEKTRVWVYHKPAGLVTTHKDPEGRTTVFESLPKSMPRVISVGRLDLNSEGLLLLTNDGAFARMAELPETKWKRTYRVRVFGIVDEARLNSLKNGITIKGIRYQSIDATLSKQTGQNAWLLITLVEGKNREIRRIMEHLGYKVNRLIRIGYGPFELNELPLREVEEVPGSILQKLFPTKQEKSKKEKKA